MEYTNENQQTQENAPQEMKEEKSTASRETAKDVIARLSKKKKAERTELLEAKKKVHAVAESAKIAKLKKKLEDAKRTAIIKNLDANNITTENEIKAVLSMRNILHESNITTPQVLRQVIEAAKQARPDLFSGSGNN